MRKWRRELPFDLTKHIQSHCLTVMGALGYKIATNHTTLVNYSIPLFTEKEQLRSPWIGDFMLKL